MDNVRLTTGHFRWTIALDAWLERAVEEEKEEEKKTTYNNNNDQIIKLVVTDPDTTRNGGIIPASSSSRIHVILFSFSSSLWKLNLMFLNPTAFSASRGFFSVTHDQNFGEFPKAAY